MTDLVWGNPSDLHRFYGASAEEECNKKIQINVYLCSGWLWGVIRVSRCDWLEEQSECFLSLLMDGCSIISFSDFAGHLWLWAAMRRLSKTMVRVPQMEMCSCSYRCGIWGITHGRKQQKMWWCGPCIGGRCLSWNAKKMNWEIPSSKTLWTLKVGLIVVSIHAIAS